jgi:murein DD-endopeptidase MepM/ murein hydrolase activator NlpD
MIKFALAIGAGLALTVLCFTGLHPAADAADNRLSPRPPEIVISAKKISNGSLLALQIVTRKTDSPFNAAKIIFQERVYPVYPHPVDPAHRNFGLISIPFRAAPGPAKLELTWSTGTENQSKTIPFDIVAGKYRIDMLTVDSGRVNPTPQNRQRAKKEARKIKRIYASGSMSRLWENDFQLPMNSKITSLYGNKRLFNGQLKSYHNGIDFHAPIGTPVFAANAGDVRLAENLFYSGNAVIVDHGTGIFTIYAHLSRIDVFSGQKIQKGQQLGLTGATGRVNGPHLHWGVKVHDVAVNPLQFIEIISSLVKKE